MKTFFAAKFHSVVDVITNSSSELFVGMHGSKDLMIEIIKEIYPNYLDEYYELKSIDELTNDELYLYIDCQYNSWSNFNQKRMHDVIEGFSFEDMYEKTDFGNYIRSDFVNNHREKIINSIDLDKKTFFLFSIGDNPNFEKQEKLEEVMTRYHLG